MRELQGVEVVNAGEQPSFEEEPAKDVLEHGVQRAAVRRSPSQVQEAARRPDGVKDAVKELSECFGLTALDPNDRQASALAQHAGHARVAWTLADFKAGLDDGEFRNDRKPRPRFGEGGGVRS